MPTFKKPSLLVKPPGKLLGGVKPTGGVKPPGGVKAPRPMGPPRTMAAGRQRQVELERAISGLVAKTRSTNVRNPKLAADVKRLRGLVGEYSRMRRYDKTFDARMYSDFEPIYKKALLILTTFNGKSQSPKKRNLRAQSYEWTTDSDTFQNHKRGVHTTLEGQQRADRLNKLFKTTALRAPHMPPGEFVNGKTPPYLYRGISYGKPGGQSFDIDGMLKRRVYADRGYIAVSRDFKVAERFADGGVILRVHLYNGIPRGTPWIWFKRTPNGRMYHREFNNTEYDSEAEVLLPPGKMIIKNIVRRSIVGTNGVRHLETIADAIYVPDSKYRFQQRRKGAGADWNAYKLPALF